MIHSPCTCATPFAGPDLGLFDGIPSQTVRADRESLLAVQRHLRAEGAYVYLEIGSHLGGTIQPHYADPRCRRIYSIDKRPLAQPDERGGTFAYTGNSTQTMRDHLHRAFPHVAAAKLTTFDADASAVDPREIDDAPDFCFIDGEHTNTAVVSDFRFCLSAAKPDALIAMHDVGVVIEGIRSIQTELRARNLHFVGIKLGGSVYAFALGTGAERWATQLASLRQDEDRFFRSAAFYRRRLRRENRLAPWPVLLGAYRRGAAAKDWLYRRVYRRIAGSGVERDAG